VLGRTWNSEPMRTMKKAQAETRPTSTATVRSKTTVSTKVPTSSRR
jgi:hypothetical protein